LGKSDGDWCWLVGDKVLKVTSGNVGIEESRNIVGIRFHLIKLDKRLGDWCICISDEVNKGTLGDVFSVQFTNELGGLWSSSSFLPVWSLIISGIITIIIRETFIESRGEGNTSWVIWIVSWWVSNIFWDSSDHHADGNIVVVRLVFLLISVFLQDGVEGVVTDDLSETFEGNRFDVVEIVGWRDSDGNWFNLIDWDIEVLGPFSPFSSISSFSSNKGL